MKGIFSLSPALLGVCIVIQAGLNRKIAAVWGLPAAVTLNAVVLTFGAGAMALLWGNVLAVDLKPFTPWFLLPGMIGMALVFGGPWAISRWGAAHTFTLVVSAQLAASAAWDIGVEGIAVTPRRWIGISLAWLGVLVAFKGG